MESPMMRSLPQSIEAEQSVIGAMIIDKSAIAQVLEKLNEDDFYRDGHKAIYKAIKEMYAKDMAVDLVTILEYLKTTDMLDKAGGVTYISELSASVPTTANLSSYIKIVEEKSTLRKLIKASTSIIEESYNSGGDVEKVIDLAQKKVFDIAEKKDSKEYESLSNVLERGFLEIERQVSTEIEPLKRIKNFNEFHKPLSRDEQSCQGARCMDCGVPFCQNGKMIQGMVSGCPLNNLIPEWNDLIFHKNYKAALKRLLKTNNFPEFTSRVCPALCEAACYYRAKGETLWDQMNNIYEKYGYYKETQVSIVLEGAEGAEKIQEMMSNMRNTSIEEIGKYKVLEFKDIDRDYVKNMVTGEESKSGLPKSNVLYYGLEDNSWCCVRPSGTEPKIKLYMGIKGKSEEDADQKLEELKNAMVAIVK